MQNRQPFLHRIVRAAFIEEGTSLSAWCRQNGVHRQYADKCLKFKSIGPKATALRTRLMQAAGIDDAT